MVVVEILSLKSAWTTGRSLELRAEHYFVERQRFRHVQHAYIFSDVIADTFQVADRMKRLRQRASAAADHCRIGVRSEHGNCLDLLFVEWQQVVIVLQQNNATPPLFECDFHSLPAVQRNFWIRLFSIIKTKFNRLSQDAPHFAVD